MPYLYGSRVTLREYRVDDLEAIRGWVNDPETVRYLSSRYWMPQSASNTGEFFDHATHAVGNAAFFVIADRATDRYLGQIDLPSINWKLHSAEVAMVIGKGENRSKGFGEEALRLILEHAFQTLGLERVELEVHMENAAAKRCYEKVGFQLEGVKRHAFFNDGHFADVAWMSVLAEEWRAARTDA